MSFIDDIGDIAEDYLVNPILGQISAGDSLGLPISETLFGESPRVQQSSLPTTTPEQQAALNELLSMLQGQVGEGPIGGIGPQQQRLLSTIIGQAGHIPTMDQLSSPLFESAESALTNILSGGGRRTPEEFNEFFRTTVQDPLVESFREEVIPGSGIKFGTNLFSSSREKFLGEQMEDLTTTLARERSRLAYEDRNQGMQDLFTALGIAPAIQGIQSQLFQQALAGDVQSFNELMGAFGIAGAERDALMQDEQLRQNLLQLLLGAATGQTIENLAVVDPGSAGLVNSFLGGGGGSTALSLLFGGGGAGAGMSAGVGGALGAGIGAGI